MLSSTTDNLHSVAATLLSHNSFVVIVSIYVFSHPGFLVRLSHGCLRRGLVRIPPALGKQPVGPLDAADQHQLAVRSNRQAAGHEPCVAVVPTLLPSLASGLHAMKRRVFTRRPRRRRVLGCGTMYVRGEVFVLGLG